MRRRSGRIAFWEFLSGLQNITMQIAMTFFLTWRVYSGLISIGDYAALLNSSYVLMFQLQALAALLPAFYEHSLYIENLREIMDSEPLIEKEGGLDIDCSQPVEIEFCKVSFSYPGTKHVVLDPISEHEINSRLYEIAKGKTVIVISHRLSTTKDADQIYYMEKGRVAESGSHRDLMDGKGVITMGEIRKVIKMNVFYTGLILGLFVNIIMVVSSLLMGRMLDNFLEGYLPYSFLLIYLLLIAVEYCLKLVGVGKLEKWYKERNREFKIKIVERVIKAKYSQLSAMREGELVEIITNELQSYFDLVKYIFVEGIPSVFIMVVAFVVCLLISWQLTIVGFLMIPVMIILGNLVSLPIKNMVSQRGETKTELSGFLLNSIRLCDVVSIYSLQDIMKEKMGSKLSGIWKIEERMACRESISDVIQLMMGVVPYIVFFIGGGFLVLEGQITVGVFYIFLTVFSNVYQGLPNMQQLMMSIRKMEGYGGRIKKVLDLEQEEKGKGLDENCRMEPENSIRADGISYSYDREKTVLNKLSLTVPANKITAILGENGRGKSTLIKLLATLYFPQEGHIYYGKTQLLQENMEMIRERIAYVPQKCKIFYGTLRENISLGRQYSNEEIEDACKKVGLWEEICRYEKGLDTILENEGRNLSGGQMQRINICRAVVRNPLWLFLDEITSSLDPINRSLVLQTIKNVSNNCCTVVYVTHNRDDLVIADDVIQL
jgi:ABC-type multidrug transport system, ATPase and permease components